MSRFSGSALYLAWVHSGGTSLLHSDFRQFSYQPTLSLIDASAGSDSFRQYIAGIGEGGDISLTMVLPQNGTAILSATARATTGTLLFGPEGTATGKPKYTIPAMSKGPAFNQSYDDIVEVTIGFQQTSQETQATW